MKITFHSDGIEVKHAVDAAEEEKVCDLLDWLRLDLETFPREGQMLHFNIGKYSLDAKVQYSYINYCEPGNKRFRKECWGVSYDVYLEYIEIIETFK